MSVSSVTSSRERKSAGFSSRNTSCWGAPLPTSCGSLSSCTAQWVLTHRSMTWLSLLPFKVGMAMMMLWMP